MQEHHGSAKETDITKVLVVAFVLMLGVLIAKTAGDFVNQSTSTSTKAATQGQSAANAFKAYAAKLAAQQAASKNAKTTQLKAGAKVAAKAGVKPGEGGVGGTGTGGTGNRGGQATQQLDSADDKCKATKPFNESSYYSTNDNCRPLTGCLSSSLEDFTSYGGCGTGNVCCRNSEVSSLGTAHCRKIAPGNATGVECTQASSCKDGKIKVSGGNDCGYASYGDLSTGTCCMSTVTAAPTPSPTPITLSDTNCGKNNIDCTATFGNDTNIKCYMEVGTTRAWCGYSVGVSTQCGNSGKYAYPIKKTANGGNILNSYCLRELVEGSRKPEGVNDYICSFGLLEISTAKSGVATTEDERKTECRTKAAPTTHSSLE